MSEREKVIERIHEAIDMGVCVDLFMDVLELLKERDTQKFLVDEDGKITPLPVVVRCKDCIFGKREKNDSTGMTWIYCGHHRENRPEDWFCADGEKLQ